MKNLVFFLFLIITLSIQAQTSIYHPFPDTNAIWNEQYNMGLSCTYSENYSYIIGRDTIIGTNNYHQLIIPYVLRSGDTTCTIVHYDGYVGCYRHNVVSKKVFYVSKNDTIEHLLYDFSLQVGGITPGFSMWGCTVSPDYITAIDSIFIGTDYRKMWIVGTPPYNNSIIEGIGYSTGLLYGCIGYLDSPFSQLTCFQQNNLTLYPDSNSNCGIINLIESNSRKETPIEIYPNPFCSEAIFKILDINFLDSKLKIFDQNGKLIKQLIITSQSTAIILDNIPKGLYFYQLNNKKNQIMSGKFVIK